MRSPARFDAETGRVTRLRVVPDSACGKKIYTTRKIALQVAAIARKERGENVHAYHCFPCHGWHIGHPPGAPRRMEDV